MTTFQRFTPDQQFTAAMEFENASDRALDLAATKTGQIVVTQKGSGEKIVFPGLKEFREFCQYALAATEKAP